MEIYQPPRACGAQEIHYAAKTTVSGTEVPRACAYQCPLPLSWLSGKPLCALAFLLVVHGDILLKMLKPV